MLRLRKFVIVILFAAALTAVSWTVMAAAQTDQAPAESVRADETSAVTAVTLTPADLIQDGSFEAGTPNPAWEEASPGWGTPLCNLANCGSSGARTGDFWAWYTANGAVTDTAYLSQTLVISQAGSAVLDFYLRLPAISSGSTSLFQVTLDDDLLFELTDTVTNQAAYAAYTRVSRNITPYADALTHTLRFSATTAPGASFYLDDVALTVGDAFLYLPILSTGCGTAQYNEILRYNMDTIRGPESWGCSQGRDVIVAVLDTGVNLAHPDLQANLVPGNTFVPGTSSPEDDNGHGTHVAGIIGAVINNGGVIGVAPQAKIMPVKVLDSTGIGGLDQIANGITWAANNGAQVINLSLGAFGDYKVLRDAVNLAYNDKGVLIVASAGNCGDPLTWRLNVCPSLDATSWPAAYANAMAVASTDENDNQSSFSTQASYVEIAAPGSNIYSTYLNGNYATASGTSQAGPHVAGLAAAVWSVSPGWTNAQVRAAIQNTAVDLGAAGRDDQFGYGRIDAFEAVNYSGSPAVVTAVPEPAAAAVAPEDLPFVPGEILFKLEPGYTVADVLGGRLASLNSIQITEAVPALDVQLMVVPEGEEATAVAALNATEGVAYAELNYIFRLND